MADELVCTVCPHSRRAHSIVGCTGRDENFNPCWCPVEFTEKDKFVKGKVGPLG